MSTIGERRHAESSHEAPPEKKSKSEYHSPSLKSKLEELKARTIAMMESQGDFQLQQNTSTKLYCSTAGDAGGNAKKGH